MYRCIACLGLISCLVWGAQGKEHVEVTRDITVKPTPKQLMKEEDRVDVVLNCTGSRTDLSFYIKNRVQWDFINTKGDVEGLTESFYKAPKSGYADEHFASGHFAFKYVEDALGRYVFNLKVNGVTRADNGVYKCSLLNESDAVIDSKEVMLTVVNPVEMVKVEIYDAKRKLVTESSSPVTQNTSPVKLVPGKYMVKCDASGSNPAPVLNLFLNDQKPYVNIETLADISTEFQSYKGSFEVMDLTINAHNSPQALVCTANLPDSQYYDTMEAGIALLVTIEKPTIVCKNATASVGDRYSKIECHVTAEGNNNALTCDNVSWYLGNKQKAIQADQKWKDTSKEYDIMEATCEKHQDGLHVELNLFSVKEVLFEETYFLVYGKGPNVHRHPILLYDVTIAAAGIATPLSLLACLVMAAVSRHLALL